MSTDAAAETPAAAAADPPAAPETAANEDTTELAKKLQNPIGNLISFPFQSLTNSFSDGPRTPSCGNCRRWLEYRQRR